MFGKKRDHTEEKRDASPVLADPRFLIVSGDDGCLAEAVTPVVAPLKVEQVSGMESINSRVAAAESVLAVSLEPSKLTELREAVLCERERRKDGTPTLIVAVETPRLTDFGRWFSDSATSNRLQGMRLIVTTSPADIPPLLRSRLGPISEPNVITMPSSPEIQNSKVQYLFAMSPELRRVVSLMRGFAENGVNRVYLLGGPGTGKSTLAYYYYLIRNKGNFVQVNLTAESTGDKAAMKSLLCGHVAGAFPGASTREGALSFARDGVCFLDESHGVTGVVMQVLMEVLDSGQYLPYGATAKRQLECAVIFASNRSWESLRSLIHLDEHARLGAFLITIPDLVKREEDLIAVLVTTLAKFAGQCTTWTPPQGVSPAAWEAIRTCRWRGNLRTLMRVVETACVAYATNGPRGELLEESHIQQGLELWEPADHKDLDMFVSY